MSSEPSTTEEGAWVVIAGGGTAGHVVPGLAIAAELVDRGIPRSGIHYVGSERGIETRLVPAAGIELTVLPGRGIQRRFTVDNLASVFGIIKAFFISLRLLRKLRPSVVVGLGGYASVPCTMAAAVLRVPLVVAEQNAVPGAANRLTAKFAKACAVSFPGTDLPRATVTGNPVRAEVLGVDRSAQRDPARARLGIDPGRFLLVVFGGSLGARRINEALFEALPEWRDRTDLAIHHVAGARDYDDLLTRIPVERDDQLAFDLVRYEDDMPSVYAAADLILCRSGASSVAELAVAGVPAVLVPLPGAPGDHQTANAGALVDAGGAVMIADSELNGPALRSIVDSLRGDTARLEAMSSAAAGSARRDAAAAVADLVIGHASAPIQSPPEVAHGS